MKAKYFGLLILCLSISCISPDKKSDLSKINLKGQVKSIKEITYYAIDKSESIEKGNRTENTDSNFDVYIEFNSYGNKVEETIMRSEDYLCRKTLYIYDNWNRIKEITEQYIDGRIIEKMVYDYESSNDYVIENTYNKEGQNTYKRHLKFKDGNNIEIKMYEYEYYANNFNYNGKYKSEFNEDGNKIETLSYDFRNSLDFQWIYKYDNRQNIIETRYINFERSLDITTKFDYQFDSSGNWIRRIEFTDNVPSFIVEREIEYY